MCLDSCLHPTNLCLPPPKAFLPSVFSHTISGGHRKSSILMNSPPTDPTILVNACWQTILANRLVRILNSYLIWGLKRYLVVRNNRCSYSKTVCSSDVGWLIIACNPSSKDSAPSSGLCEHLHSHAHTHQHILFVRS